MACRPGGGVVWGAWRRRFRQPLPLGFLVVALCALIGGVLYAPGNYDSLTYRIPRMLNWLAEGQWHWIHTPTVRMNGRPTNWEWLAMPFLVFTHSGRLVFLLNVVSFLLLPGLIFSVFSRLGVVPRVAYAWMWLLPTAYGVVLQVSSNANDIFALPYVLAALDFALRARRSGRVSQAWLSLLAAALVTGTKSSNLTLLLPWAVALAPSWRLFLGRRLASLAVAALAVGVSILPTAVLNHRYCGDWSGVVLEPSLAKCSPAMGLIGNTLHLVVGNFVPPIFPLAGWWNDHRLGFFPVGFRQRLEAAWEPPVLRLGEVPVEDSAGLGFGLAMLLAVSLFWVWRWRGRQGSAARPRPQAARAFASGFGLLLVVLPWVSLLVFMVKVSSFAAARVVLPYYPLLVPLLLWPGGQGTLVRQAWWRRSALAVCALAVLVLVVNPARPLWPARTALAWLQERWPGTKLLARAAKVYAVYGQRSDALAPVRQLLPPGVDCFGFVGGGDDPEASLWLPFGQRRLIHVMPSKTGPDLPDGRLEYVIVSLNALDECYRLTLADFLQQCSGRVVGEVSFTHRAAAAPARWCLVQLPKSRARAP